MGIWEALITTAAALLVAIPIHMVHHYLENLAQEVDVGLLVSVIEEVRLARVKLPALKGEASR